MKPCKLLTMPFPKRRPLAGILTDVQERLPFYASDWRDAWSYRVVPATLLAYFTNIFPAIAFAQDMFDKTGNAYGVNEVLLASALAGIVFGVVGGQPLTIVGVTGPITIFNYTVYEIMVGSSQDGKGMLDKSQFFPFMFWIAIWACAAHIIIAVLNGVGALRYVTQFPCDVFGLFINIVYLQKGVQILTRQFGNGASGDNDGAAGFASCVIAIVMGVTGLAGSLFGETQYFNKHIRQFVVDYSTPLAVVFFTGMIHFGGYFQKIEFQKLQITRSWFPTSRTNWVEVNGLPVRYVFLALPFGLILTILFYFDHSISSLMAQSYRYKLRKPAAFHYDFLLLGIVTAIAGLLGIPCPNGLIPQAPLHTESLLITDHDGHVFGCVEQRFSNTVQGLLLLGTMTRPLLVCLGLIPQCVLAGLFFIMGAKGLHGNEILNRVRFCCQEKRYSNSPLQYVPKKKLYLFLMFSLCGFVAEFAIVNTRGAIGFPLVLLLTVIVAFYFKLWFTQDDLKILDGPVAHENTVKNL